ncbi:MAG: histidine kinase [Propioniciclava sp.]|uniref:sensor histidine kinase n=1 Tax=Propioniciclava sp. TaxID=2038686 RepID=UPI0039E335CB
MTSPVPHARSGNLAAFGVAGLFWAYYMTPMIVRADRGAFALIVGLPGLIAIGALALRRTRPGMTLAVTAACLVLSSAATGACFVAMAQLSRRTERPGGVVAGAAALLAAKTVQLAIPFGGQSVLDGINSAAAFEFIVLSSGLAIAVLTGRLARSREREEASRAASAAARAEAEQARLAEARLAERARIAREMHDVVAHRISLVAMRAGVLAHGGPDAHTREEARLIQGTAREALAELRIVLADLRGADAPPEPPQPTLAELPALVAEARDAGQQVRLGLAVDAAEVPARLSRQAYRIVQEGLTNARKHAPGALVSVEVTGRRGDRLSVEIINPVADLALPDTTGAGLGLVGVAERVALLGGTVSHGVTSGTFKLSASLPWTEAA